MPGDTRPFHLHLKLESLLEDNENLVDDALTVFSADHTQAIVTFTSPLTGEWMLVTFSSPLTGEWMLVTFTSPLTGEWMLVTFASPFKGG